MPDPATTISAFDLAVAIKAGKDLTQVHDFKDRRPYVSMPVGHQLVAVPMEKLPAPRFLTAAPSFNDPATFNEYVAKYKTPDTRIWFTQEGEFVAVIDYHGVDAARHGDHVVKLQLIHSPEWEIWASAENNDVSKIQTEFAEFIEDNARDIIKPDEEPNLPDAAYMLEVASGLHATSNATFRSSINQANGTAQFQYDENVEGTVKGSSAAVPTVFKVGLRPFIGTDRYPVECRLRYKIQGGLRLRYKALHLDPILEAALTHVVGVIQEGTGIRPALGGHDAAIVAKGQ